MKAIRKDVSGNVPRNDVFNFLLGIDKVPATKHAVKKNEQLAALVDHSTGKGRAVSSDHTTQVPKNDHKSKKGTNNDPAVIAEQDSCTKQASRNEQSEETERRRASCNESARRRKMQTRRRYREQQAETEAARQLTKTEKVNFVMNSEGCFINGKPFDPRNPPKGIAIVADQKNAVSENQSKKKK